MHREEGRAQSRDAFNALRNGIADVVQLEIEEDALARAGEHARKIDPAGEGELIADLVERHRFAQPRHQRLRLGDGADIERDDQAFARIELHGRPPGSCAPDATRHEAR